MQNFVLSLSHTQGNHIEEQSWNIIYCLNIALICSLKLSTVILNSLLTLYVIYGRLQSLYFAYRSETEETIRATFRLHTKADLEERKGCRGHGGYPRMYIHHYAKISKITC